MTRTPEREELIKRVSERLKQCDLDQHIERINHVTAELAAVTDPRPPEARMEEHLAAINNNILLLSDQLYRIAARLQVPGLDLDSDEYVAVRRYYR